MQSLTSTFSSRTPAPIEFHMYTGPPARPTRPNGSVVPSRSHDDAGDSDGDSFVDIDLLLQSCREEVEQHSESGSASGVLDSQVAPHRNNGGSVEPMLNCPAQTSLQKCVPVVDLTMSSPHASSPASESPRASDALGVSQADGSSDCQAHAQREDPMPDSAGPDEVPLPTLTLNHGLEELPAPAEDAPLLLTQKDRIVAMKTGLGLSATRAADLADGALQEPSSSVPALLSPPCMNGDQQATYSQQHTPVPCSNARCNCVPGDDTDQANSPDEDDALPLRPRRRVLHRVAKASRALHGRLATPHAPHEKPPDCEPRYCRQHDLFNATHQAASDAMSSPCSNDSAVRDLELDTRIVWSHNSGGDCVLLQLPVSLFASVFATLRSCDGAAKPIVARTGAGAKRTIASRAQIRRSPPRQQRCKATVRPYTEEEDELLVELKEHSYPPLSWKEIARRFPGRSVGSLQVHYCTALKAR